jgi:hypothetical protein
MAIFTTTFVADNSGGTISFVPSVDAELTLDNITIKKVIVSAVEDNIPIKEFLTGNTDEGKEIFFRADTQTLQIQPSPQMYSNPIAIITEVERGTQLKAFISLDDKPFYQLEGTVTKGVSIVKPNAASNEKVKPPLAQSIQLSYRDSSKQLCRLIQAAVITTPTTIDYSP